ncbi:MAG: nuclease-related domain-containing protein [Clostridia bacterium]
MELLYMLLQYLLIILAFVILANCIKIVFFKRKMEKSNYQSVSGNNLWKTLFNRGNYGEFLTFAILEELREDKILTNIYLPSNSEETTEIDLLMVNKTGIYVFESKNYSGWIFGNEKNKMWTQSLKGGLKNKFFNPIWQNKAHITALDNYLDKKYSKYIYSYIVFSERCELKKIEVKSENVTVIKRNDLIKSLNNRTAQLDAVLTEQEINGIYESLKKKTLVDDITKQKHIHDIKKKLNANG